jgi:pimeloyl-ACP methyl ester carboxylesterase
MTKTILFVTGAFVSNRCWDEWQTYYQSKGYETYAPAWPHKSGSVQNLRSLQPDDTELADLTLTDVIDHYATFAKSFAKKPVIIGHSLGGMMTQILLNRDLAAAAVAIHPVAPQGIFPYEFSFLKGSWRSLGLFTSIKKTYLMSFKTWQYAFVNDMPLKEQQDAYDKLTIPESKRVVRGGLTSAAKVDFSKAHAPLLIVSGEKDNLIPPHLNYRNFRKYKQNGSVLEYKEFPGRNHHILGQPTWKEDAAYILNWIEKY